ncbi:hypothetical protein C7C46_28340 [Streptomyces tateyamensis]|uniref:Uncharacterized protein n=1 Tax=Streptomyces tateyamensis TaxID=565073 RepID=A0A2V4N940_9ACTN|nr:DUF6296 family protein [Streptomyces tateyamensis]PYC69160.1 hypothetical protein C7C46_28340 [Streptomyces tateyamensis]
MTPSYELTFEGEDGHRDVVVVHPTEAIGPHGARVYRDVTEIIQVEIDEHGEMVMLPTSFHQHPRHPTASRRLDDDSG